MTLTTLDTQALAQLELRTYIAQQELNSLIENQADIVAPEIEVDSISDSELGLVYRVWKSYHFLGTFYRDDNRWVAQPHSFDERLRCNSPEHAQILIVAISLLRSFCVCQPHCIEEYRQWLSSDEVITAIVSA